MSFNYSYEVTFLDAKKIACIKNMGDSEFPRKKNKFTKEGHDNKTRGTIILRGQLENGFFSNSKR